MSPLQRINITCFICWLDWPNQPAEVDFRVSVSFFPPPPAQKHNAAHQPPDQPRHQRVSAPPTHTCIQNRPLRGWSHVTTSHPPHPQQINKLEQREKFPLACSALVVKCSESLDKSACSEVSGRRKQISLEAISSHFQDLQLHKSLQSPVNHFLFFFLAANCRLQQEVNIACVRKWGNGFRVCFQSTWKA